MAEHENYDDFLDEFFRGSSTRTTRLSLPPSTEVPAHPSPHRSVPSSTNSSARSPPQHTSITSPYASAHPSSHRSVPSSTNSSAQSPPQHSSIFSPYASAHPSSHRSVPSSTNSSAQSPPQHSSIFSPYASAHPSSHRSVPSSTNSSARSPPQHTSITSPYASASPSAFSPAPPSRHHYHVPPSTGPSNNPFTHSSSRSPAHDSAVPSAYTSASPSASTPASTSAHHPAYSPTHNPFSNSSSYTWGNPTDSTQDYKPGRKKIRQNMSFLSKRRALPIWPYKSEIIRRIEQSQVVIIEGETGSGKSTQIPQWCLEVENVSKVVCSQPRRIAAISLANRVAHEMGVGVGDEVGYVVRFEHKSSLTTNLKYVTDGILVRQLMTDRSLEAYDVIIIDEVHERRLVTDILIGLIKQILPYRPELRIVIMSATLNKNKFSDFFENCGNLKIPGQIYPIEKIFSPAVIERAAFGEDDQKRYEKYVIQAINVVMEICIMERTQGDILVFVTGRDEIDYICEYLEDLCVTYKDSMGTIDIIPLYGELPYSSQQRIFAKAPKSFQGRISRKCIIATNIAETSITIEGIVFVIDSGKVKLSSVDQKCHMKSLLPVDISKSSAEQRAGRAGRTQPGKCYRLYSQDAYEAMANDTIPEIMRSDLTSVILQLKVMGIDLETFESIDQPNPDQRQLALERLIQLNALDPYHNVTEIGRQMARFPLDAEVSRMLVASKDYSCQNEILTLAAMLSGDRPGSVFVLVGKKKREKAMEARGQFAHPSGDHLTYINVFNHFKANGCREDWCFDKFLNFKILNEASTIHSQLEHIMIELNFLDHNSLRYSSPAKDSNILKAILTGNISQLAQRDPLQPHVGSRQQFITVLDNLKVTLHPSCTLSEYTQYELLCYSSCLKTNARKSYISTVSSINMEWYDEVAGTTGAPSLMKRRAERMHLLSFMTELELSQLFNDFNI
ncbi:Pre-mRNA-splicing factor ATP-dependent RNA helicase PRP1 [Oopsacas minuta]|uniref:RNA helicase n=1 Tax=Oopsacas minuta TaxID=111878 RepID=A0AAV7KB31_9METZ|nr:Pre-mRNA-splicing factor ATP-dependent RNA helicase PRP1 [Oopsacas minuta]